MFGEGWYAWFLLVNLYIITAVIALVEITFLSSINRAVVRRQHSLYSCRTLLIQWSQQAVGVLVLSLILVSCLYLGWAAIGKALTGWSAFFWLSEKDVGSREAVAAYCLGFVGLSLLGMKLTGDNPAQGLI
jgi:hypothetical protein